jgi:long-chain acyl-CoA synthetase
MNTKRDADIGETLVELLERSAIRFGPKPALLFKPGFRYQRWSYADLWEASGSMATLLQQRGLVQGDRALIWGPNCPQWVIAFFGCLRAGVVAVPLDLRTSDDFARLVVERTRPKMAFVSRLTPSAHEDLGLSEIAFEEQGQLIEKLPQPTGVVVTPDDLAEVMFTSGTTGDPKGVMLSHKNLMANVESIAQFVPGSESDRLLSILPLSHMFEQMGGLFSALRMGANVTYPTSRQPTVLFRTMKESRVTMMMLVPQALDLFMKGIEREVRRQGKERQWDLLMKIAARSPRWLRRFMFRSLHSKFGGSLSFIFAGGAALDHALGTKWERLGIDVIQGYGATEASPVISSHPASRPRFDSPGLPMPGVEIRISPDGEVLVRGANVTSGYWEAPAKTAASFEDGWYKTGDQGFLDSDGFLHLNGRKKDMIVLASGQNVYPEDIEQTLNRHEAVEDSAVVGLPRGTDTEVHAALLMVDSTAASDAIAWANAQLGEHQQVRGFTIWPEDDFPRTHTMKTKKGVVIDALLATDAGTAGADSPDVRPAANEGPNLEGLIAEVAQMKAAEIEPNMTLGADLGLDSLRRVELLSAIEGDLGVYLDETTVSAETTVAQLAVLVKESAAGPGAFHFPTWGMSWWCRPLRGILQRVVIFPFLRWMYRLRVLDERHLDRNGGPVLYAANHTLSLDNVLFIKSLPSEKRKRLAIAASDHMFSNPLQATIIPALGNGFPFSKEGAIRPSLENVGRIIDNGWSVLIYPEGELTPGGPMKPFLAGTGLLALESGIPVVPIRLHIRKMGNPRRIPFLRRGDVEVRFGEPLHFSRSTPYLEATAAIERAVREL